MTTETVTREIKEAEGRLRLLKERLRVCRYMDRLRSGATIPARTYQVLESMPDGALALKTMAVARKVHGGDATQEQYYAVESALRSMRATGVVTKLGYGMYAATSRLADAGVHPPPPVV